MRHLRLAGLALMALALPATAAPVPAVPGRPVDLVLCLDVSNSMDGLIDSAKLKLWDVVNELAKVKPTPTLRVGLYSYGHSGYPKEKGWVRKELDLTTDLDEVYAKLNGLKTGGGNEYVARVCRDALDDQKWSSEKDALKIVFVCGNEPADQDKEVGLSEVSKLAIDKKVIINTIFCGPESSAEYGLWKSFATDSAGQAAYISQDKARQEAIATPHDKEIAELSGKLNTTYLACKSDEKRAANQSLQDGNANKAAPAAAAERGISKANGLYRNDDWCLVEKFQNDPKFDLSRIKEEDLPEELKKLKPEERPAYLKKKLEERLELQKKINELAGKRAKFIEEERKKQPRNENEKALDESLKATIRTQAAGKGFEVPK
jgi:hypothetical protein